MDARLTHLFPPYHMPSTFIPTFRLIPRSHRCIVITFTHGLFLIGRPLLLFPKAPLRNPIPTHMLYSYWLPLRYVSTCILIRLLIVLPLVPEHSYLLPIVPFHSYWTIVIVPLSVSQPLPRVYKHLAIRRRRSALSWSIPLALLEVHPNYPSHYPTISSVLSDL